MEEALKRALKSKVKYNAERISRTEIARSYNEAFNARIADNPEVTGYKWLLSSRHVIEDECTMLAELDNGQGPGVYRKDDFPAIPVHPNCMCMKVEHYGAAPKLTQYRNVIEYLKGQPESRRARFIGKRNAQHLALFGRGLEQRGIRLGDQGTIRRIPGDLIVPKNNLQNGGAGSILMNVDRDNTISSPIEQGRTDGVGEPWAISRHGKPLNDRQQALLDQLPEFDSRVEVDKSDISMMDLAALTAKTGDEFAMFTIGSKRLIVRGNAGTVNINPNKAAEMNALGYKWSGHTHVGDQKTHLRQSLGDVAVLRAFTQPITVIYNSVGEHKTFGKGQ